MEYLTAGSASYAPRVKPSSIFTSIDKQEWLGLNTDQWEKANKIITKMDNLFGCRIVDQIIPRVAVNHDLIKVVDG